MITLLVLHSQRLIREIWIGFLTSRPGLKVVAAASDFEQAADQARYTKPKIAVIYTEFITAPGIKDLSRIRETSPDTRLILTTSNDATVLHPRLHDAGVRACLSKQNSLHEMVTAVHQVNAGLVFPREAPAAGPVTPQIAGLTRLTPKELDILTHLEKGRTSREIGVLMNLSYRTVEVHRYHLLKKMECKRTTELLKKLAQTSPG